MIFLKLETISPALSFKFSELSGDEIQKEVDLIKAFIDMTISSVRGRTSSIITWHSFELPIYPAFGMLDFRSESLQHGIIDDLNRYLKKQLFNNENCFYIDLNNICSLIGVNKFYDNRYWHIGKAPYTLDALKNISINNFKLIRALKGKNKKCLVLDCDNTIWGGIVGEDGIDGIKISTNYPGSAFYAFQQEILNLYHRGIIIALCSKNNDFDVWNVLDNHPDMLLKRNHISTAQINWNNKAENIQKIAIELNVGLDSLVFVDDNEFEVELINKYLPEVETIHLPRGRAIDYKNILASCGYFDSLSYTNEDRIRGAQYQAESSRKKASKEFIGNLDEYLESLDMVVDLDMADSFSIPRIAQLTQKTNQFNLTTKRYSEADIKVFSESINYDVLTIKLKDRFGDLGIVGCSIIQKNENKANIDTFLLSCRAIGRGIETVLLNASIDVMKSNKIEIVQSFFAQTKKNVQVKSFYEDHGFEVLRNDEDNICFMIEVNSYLNNHKKYFKKINANY
jgi:FkbH-like protein